MANSDVIELISLASLSESDVRLLREDNCIEAKKAKDKLPDSLWDTYSAFANSDGGLILLGVSENSRRELNVTGVTDAEKLKRDFWNTVNDRSKVNATVLSDQDVVIRHGSSGDFIVIHVPRAGREIMPIYVGADPFSREQHRGTFRRNNEGDYHCDRDEVKAMFRDGSDTPQDLRIVEDLGSAALDSGTIASYCGNSQIISLTIVKKLDSIVGMIALPLLTEFGPATYMIFGSQYMVGCGRRCRAHSVWTEKRDVWMKIPWKSLFARR